jgi:hypothetical protein
MIQTMTQTRRVCVACLNELAEPGQVRCNGCGAARDHRQKPPTPHGLSELVADQLRQAGIDPKLAAPYLNP